MFKNNNSILALIKMRLMMVEEDFFDQTSLEEDDSFLDEIDLEGW